MRNAEIADALTELATLYELDGAIRYRVLAYREAARVIRQSPVSVEELARAGRATELPGVGETLEEKIVALLDTGEIPSAAKLKRKFPRVAGRGDAGSRASARRPRGASTTSSASPTSTTCARRPRGSGSARSRGSARRPRRTCSPRSASSPTAGPTERLLLSEVLPIAEQLAADLRDHPASEAVEVAGSARRRAETCHDIDLIATSSDPVALSQALAGPPARRRRRVAA